MYKSFRSFWPFYTEQMKHNVQEILTSGKVNQWTGSKVKEFEKAFEKYFGIKHAVAVFNGSVALELCLKVLGVGSGDEVIVTSRSFIASASSINVVGAMPVFIDVDYISQNVSLETIIPAVNNLTKAIIVVHLAGWPANMPEIMEYCKKRGIFVIEDCAQAHGAKIDNQYVGTFGDINAWSFCQDKIISTGGEGGMVTTNNDQLFQKAWSYKDHGKNPEKISIPSEPGMFKYVHDSIGTNFRMTEIQASIGLDQLVELDGWVKQRRTNAHILDNILSKNKLIRLSIPDSNIYHSYYKYYCFVNEGRDEIIKKMNEAGVPCFQGTCGECYKEEAYGLDLQLANTRKLSLESLVFLVDPSYDVDRMKLMAKIIIGVIESYSEK